MARILIIEDEESIRRVLSKILVQSDPSHEIIEAKDGLEGIQIINQDDTIDLVFCDIKMPKKDGIEVLQAIGDHTDELPVIMISGHGDLETAVACMRLGAFDYLSKPPDLNRLLTTAKNGLERKKIKSENKRLKKRLAQSDQMIGDSAALNAIRSMIDKVSDTSARVLITGPNGSGKELVAKALHQNSSRSSSSFVEVNCAAIPSELIESELFGHVKGAFTSAHKDRSGKFEIAHGGTLFLDEIGDMSLSAQAKVLRALQESQIVRVGAEKPIKVDVRVIAATNKNLRHEIEKGRFREDLYHRLSVILIEVPALDSRKEDIPELIDHFSTQIAEQMGVVNKPFDKDALKVLVSRSYPGNIRELRNIVERLMILSDDKITLELVRSFAL
ncbi:MAG: sigma-54-dependent Fis family transcriptional regulator [Flavobacteriaceae bacterium]|nr:sigma-54-dependent Fis family transcriptional regulator [Flavobacteriaceae bacterium]